MNYVCIPTRREYEGISTSTYCHALKLGLRLDHEPLDLSVVV